MFLAQGSKHRIFGFDGSVLFYLILIILVMGMDFGSKSPVPDPRLCHRIDTYELKLQIERKLGRQKAEKYFNLLTRFLSLKLRKSEFSKLCVGLFGRENICLHNSLLRAIIRNACVAKTPPEKYTRRSPLQSYCKDANAYARSPRKVRIPTVRGCKFRDRPSPLGPHGKTHNGVCDSATELLSLGSRPPVEVNSVEEGEEVEQSALSPGIHSRSPVTAPLGISLHVKGARKVLSQHPAPFREVETCHSTCQLPDTTSLKKRLKEKLDVEGLNISTDCVNLLNNALDAYIKRLIKPSVKLAASRSECKLLNKINHQGISVLCGNGSMRFVQNQKQPFTVSLMDFGVAMESNPRLLGEDWPAKLEKVCLRASEDSV